MEIFDLEPVMVRGVLGKDRVDIANRLIEGTAKNDNALVSAKPRRFVMKIKMSLHAE